MSGSIHKWFEDIKYYLHLAINLCSGTIVGCYFDKQETLKGYYTIYKQIKMILFFSSNSLLLFKPNFSIVLLTQL